MKNRNLYALILAICFVVKVKSQTQLKGWHMAPHLIDLQSTTPIIKPAFTSNGATYGSNSIYDSEGKLLFYIANFGNIYNKFDNLIGTLPTLYIGTSEISIIPNPNNSACINKYFVVFTKQAPTSSCSGLCGFIQYVEIDMNGNSGLGQMITNTNPRLGIQGSTTTPFAVSKLQNGKRFLYFVNNTNELEMREVNATGISNTVNILTTNVVNPGAVELELSNTGDKIAYASSNSGFIDILPLAPSTGLPTGASPIVIPGNAASGIRGLELNTAADKIFYTQIGAGAGLYYTFLSTPTVKTLISVTYNNCMLEKNYNGTKIIAASSSNLVTIDPVTNAVGPTVSFALPTISAASSLIFMPDQIDGENYDVTGTTNVDVDAYNATTSATWNVTTNPFFALQQNSYLGTLTSFAKVRVVTSITIPNAISINMDKMTFEFHTNAQLNVNGGGNLTSTGTVMQGHPCGLMWRGVSVNNNNVSNASNFTMTNGTGFFANSIILDAIKGVEINGSNVTTNITNYSIFNKNERSVVLNSVNPSITSITKSNFYNTSPLKDQTKGLVLTTSGTVRYGITGVEANTTGSTSNKLLIGSATAGSGNYFESGQYGVRSYKTDISIQNNTFVSVDNAAINGDAAFAGYRETDIISNTFTTNRTDSWLAFGCNQISKKNTSTGCREFCMRWHYNYGAKLLIGDGTTINANTFDSYGWAGVAISDCDNVSTQIDIDKNTFQNAPGAGGVYIGESTLTSGLNTYDHYTINNNVFTNVQGAVRIINVRGHNAATNTDWNGDADLSSRNYDIRNNTISYSTVYNVNTSAINIENSVKNRAFSNGITSDNSSDYRNTGILMNTTPNCLIKGNTIQAGRGIGPGLDVTGSNILCNILKYSVIGIEPNWSWLRASGTQHGESGIRGRQNYFISNSTDIKVSYSYASAYQWISPNTTSIWYNPGGSYGTNIVYSTAESNPCGGGGSRMAGEDEGDNNAEVEETMDSNEVPAAYTDNVMVAQNTSKVFMESLESWKSGIAKTSTLINSDYLAKAQIAYNNNDWIGCDVNLQSVSTSKSLVESNIFTVLGILNTAKSQNRYEYTPAEKSAIEAIAQSDSRLGGQGVHYARGIMLVNYNQQYQDPYINSATSSISGQRKAKTLAVQEQKQLLGLYPNPARTAITIATTEGEKIITIYDNMGHKVYSANGKATLNLDVSSWNKGIYLVEIYNTYNQKKENSKFIVE